MRSLPLTDTAVVRVPVTPLTARRSTRSEQVSQAILGTRVRVMESGPRWCRIETPDRYQGWAPRRALHGGDGAPGPDAVLIRDLWANLRARPDSRLPALLTVFIGTRLAVAERREGWISLQLPGAGVGWVEAHRVSAEPPGAGEWATESGAILTTAHRFLGVPYLWGGVTPAGLDCSGYVQLVFRLHGILLRRDTTEQVTQGCPVASEELEAADLVFFGARGPESERVTHVGLMLDRTRFLHARGGQCVQSGSLEEETWRSRLAAARRVRGGRQEEFFISRREV